MTSSPAGRAASCGSASNSRGSAVTEGAGGRAARDLDLALDLAFFAGGAAGGGSVAFCFSPWKKFMTTAMGSIARRSVPVLSESATTAKKLNREREPMVERMILKSNSCYID
jgi:hypothetical protein